MTTKKTAVLVFIMISMAIALTGCSVVAMGEAEGPAMIINEGTSYGGGIDLIGHGTWRKLIGASGITGTYNVNTWLDIKVPNLSFHKTVGVAWTEDAWNTVRYAYAEYEATLDDGNERWGIDMVPLGDITIHRSMGPVYWNVAGEERRHLGYPHAPVFMDYAIFYTLPDGTTIWDNNGGSNYRLTLVD